MNRLFAFFSCTALAGSLAWTVAPLSAQSQSFAPVHGLANPFGATSAIAGQSRPLGGVGGGPSYGSSRHAGNYGRGYGTNGRGSGIYGFSTYVPGYWDYLGDPVGGPYSYTLPNYGEMGPPPPAPGAVPGGPAGPDGAAPPQVIINNYYGYPPPPGAEQGQFQPEAATHPGDPLGEPENYYLIVYKDHSIHAALAYWVEGSTLHYVTTDNAHNQVSLDLLDIDASTKLNSDHNVPFSVGGR